MRIITNLRHLHRQFKKPIVTIGIFDGVHRGHKKILRKVIREARRIGGTGIVITFSPHPSRVLDMIAPPPLLVSLKHRLRLISDEGLDAACVINFNEMFARRRARDFIKDVLVKRIGARGIVIGSEFRFGKGQKGDINLLKRLGKEFGFYAEGVPLLKIGSAPVSSTRIRRLITGGKLNAAARLLGRPVSILGTVVKGKARGRMLGFPTANIDLHHEAIPPSGVYAVYAMLEGKRYKGVLNIGFRPTFKRAGGERGIEPTVEVHISGFNKNIYGKDIEVIFAKKLRPEKKFPGECGLIKQIRIDERNALMVL